MFSGVISASERGANRREVGVETSTDTAQIIAPAGVAGVVGLKPTVGLVSRTGIVPISHSMDTAGPIARTVADAALVLSAIAGSDPADVATADADARKSDYAAALNEDALTGAQNRRAMDAVLNKEVARAMRYHRPLSAIMLDIDHFKRVNDTYGHDAGDRLLMHVTILARSVLRESDVFIRYGGEEFLLLLPDSELGGAAHVADRLRELLQESPLQTDNGRIDVNFSAGVAQLLDGENGHSLVLRTDKAMYEAKQRGRNLVACHESAASCRAAS